MYCRACGAEISDRSGPVCPVCGQHPGTPDLNTPDNMMVDPQSRNGPSFERAREMGYLGAWWATVREVIADPLGTFSRMRRDGLGSVVSYVSITGALAGAVFGLWMGLLMGVLGAITFALPNQGGGPQPPWLVMVAVYVVLPPILVPLSLLLGLFINGSLTHLALMATGGARQPWETTIRAIGYSMTALLPVYVFPPIPCLIHLIALAVMIYVLVLQVIALHESQENEWWQAAAGVLLPIVVMLAVCFGVGFLTFAIAGARSGTSFS